MYSPPLRRRIIPWIFAAAFLVTAPMLVLYTAGYRWNTKKDKIERNGTLIIDSIPSGASISLNGMDSGEKTPITLQNLAPGSYTITATKTGFRSWEKTLDVLPGQATFANTIQLWRIDELALANAHDARRLQTSPNDRSLAIALQQSTTTKIRLMDVDGANAHDIDLPDVSVSGTELQLSWSSDSRTLLVQETSMRRSEIHAWRIPLRSTIATPLPNPPYQWNGSLLESLQPRGSIVQQFGDLQLRSVTGTPTLVLFDVSQPSEGYILPEGTWTIAFANGSLAVLQHETSFISVQLDRASPSIHRARGDRLRPFMINGSSNFLLVDQNELWRWNPVRDPELLVRQQEPILDAAWDSSGESIFFATAHDLVALDLDPRGGRQFTALARADRIYAIAHADTTVFVAGITNNRDGLWTIQTE